MTTLLVRALRVTAATALLTGPLAAVAPGTSYAAGDTCDGKPATIVISSEPDAVEVGTDGDDVVLVTTPDVFMFDALGGDDTVCGGPGTTTVLGGPGNETLLLSALTQSGRVDGGPGDDTIVGGPDADTIIGGPGDDVLLGGAGNDLLLGGSGDDRVAGQQGHDSVSGGVFLDFIEEEFPDLEDTATPGDDVVTGGPGDDLVFDTTSDETLSGGPGHDTLTLDDFTVDDAEFCHGLADPTAAIVVDLPRHRVTGFGHDSIRQFESYHGGAYDETFTGTPHADHFVDGYCGVTTIHGHGGADTVQAFGCHTDVTGGPGPDSIGFSVESGGRVDAGPGNDQITITPQADLGCSEVSRALEGGPGSDWLVLDPGSASVVDAVDLFHGVAGASDGGRINLSGIENVRQLDAPRIPGARLRLVGTNGPNILIGGNGPTTIFGRHGNDVLRGGHGHDVVYGGTGHDRCRAEVRHECEAR